jgi:RNA polymerase sigma factor (TIGR02999 family)
VTPLPDDRPKAPFSPVGVEELVLRWGAGEAEAFDQLVDLLYDDLKWLAHRHMRAEEEGHTFNTTALVHEAYLQLAGGERPEWRGRPQFFAFISRVMRNILVDRARKRHAQKRGGERQRVPLREDLISETTDYDQIIAVDQALTALASRDSRLAQVAEYRFFGGMPAKEIGTVLGISSRTVERDWRRARAYLYRQLTVAGSESTESRTGT